MPKTTLGARLKTAREDPDASGLFSTRQPLAALFGSIREEQLRRVRAQADEIELRTAILRAEFLPRAELSRAFSEIADSIVQVVRVSRLTQQKQDDLLLQLSSIPVVIENTARAQTKWRGNGAGPEGARLHERNVAGVGLNFRDGAAVKIRNQPPSLAATFLLKGPTR